MKDDFIENINKNDLNMFLAKTKSKIWIDSNEEEVLIDYSWVDKVEEALPHIDKIIRNPKRFLVQEEEIINVEKSKKVTTETVMHLAQNSDLIENINELGEVQPKRVLNITREDTIDIYENRFIYTLIKNLTTFVQDQIEKCGTEGSYFKCERKVNFEGETSLKYDKVKINLSLEDNRKHEIPLLEDGQESIEERLKKINYVLSGFSTTEFIKSLVFVSPVKSPIRKTNIILKEPNFRKAAELWEFLEAYQLEEPKITKTEDIITENNDIKELYDYGYYVGFNALNLLDKKYERKQSNLFNIAFIKNLIEDYLDEVGGSEKTFTKMLKEQFKIVCKIRKKREKEIKRIIGKFLNQQFADFEKCEDILK